MKTFCVLVSGGGTNLQCLIDGVEAGTIPAEICAVISSRAGVYALERAQQHGIPAVTVARKQYATDEAYQQALYDAILASGADFIVLAGFLSILSPAIIQAFPNRILNIHPSLIPSFCGKGYYGLKVHEAVLNYGAKVTGATAHFVDEGTDTGPIILQRSVPVLPEDTPETLQQRVLEVEHDILPKAVALLAAEKICVQGRKVFLEE